MSERESFLARWSRRKLEIEEKYRAADAPDDVRQDEIPSEAPAAPGEPGESPSESGISAGTADNPEFDFLANLPSIESITETTDIRPFLTPGVPAELSRAALRRAWSVDPNIRDYIGLAENQWDFNSGELPGFGPLELTEELKKLVAEIVGGGPPRVAEAIPERTQPTQQDAAEPTAEHDESVSDPEPVAALSEQSLPVAQASPEEIARNENIVQHSKDFAALPQDEAKSAEVKPAQHGHGGALPR